MSSRRVILLTKDRCLPSKSNQFYGNYASKGLNNNNNEQFNCINLNKNNKSENIKFEQSKSTPFSKKSQNNDGFFDYKNDSKNALNDWKKNDTPNFHESLKTQEIKKEYKWETNCNKSTLSLHIEAYENLIETKNVTFASKTSFDFVKQQNKELMTPEIMQFKTSQKLLNFGNAMSLVKNLKSLTSLRPRPVITWDKSERIRRNKEIWDNKESIVHRLPLHYQHRHWKNVLADIQPVHYRPPESRYLWDTQRLVEVETEHYPIVPIKTPESDQGLWGGEGVVKGYIESKPFTRKKILPRLWLPKLWFPKLKNVILYSEVLDTHMKITVTERALRLIDDAYGLDNYLLNTPEMDINSKLGLQLKRQILISLAKETYAADDPEQHSYIKEKYRRFVIPLEEAEWVGLDLNEACRKQQDLEDNTRPEPLKYKFEKELMEQLEAGDAPLEEDTFKPQKSLFGEKLLGSVMNPLAKRMKVF